MDTLQPFVTFLTAHVYLAVFLASAIDATGVPCPGRIVLILAGTFIHSYHGLAWGVVAGTAGAVLGDHVLYLAGWRGGAALLALYCRLTSALTSIQRRTPRPKPREAEGPPTGGMQARRGLLLGILVYVTVDLASPMLPGAFVFDPSDSVESLQIARGRPEAKTAIPPAPAGDPFKLSPSILNQRSRITGIAAGAPPVHPGARHLARATVDSASRPEDPH